MAEIIGNGEWGCWGDDGGGWQCQGSRAKTTKNFGWAGEIKYKDWVSNTLAGFKQAYPNHAGTGNNYGDVFDRGGWGCTWWVNLRYGRVGQSTPWAGEAWMAFPGAVWASDIKAGYTSIETGDILVFAGHVAFVERGGAYSYISESATGNNNWNILVLTLINTNDLLSKGKHWAWGEKFLGIIKSSGVTPPDIPTPTPQPDPGPGDNWEWQLIDWEGGEGTQTFTESHDYLDIYEPGKNTIFGDQIGDQDDPIPPSQITTSTSRLNQRWEPFNSYTDERVLTYDSNHNPVWSEWSQIAMGSDYFLLGQPPSTLSGWIDDWENEGEIWYQ